MLQALGVTRIRPRGCKSDMELCERNLQVAPPSPPAGRFGCNSDIIITMPSNSLVNKFRFLYYAADESVH
jgi:hypothetical protein